MKHKCLVINFIILAAVILITAEPGICAQSVSIKQAALKFIFAMAGVALSSFVIFAGLSLYNRFFVGAKCNKFDEFDSLSTPENIDDAVRLFINKNKLR